MNKYLLLRDNKQTGPFTVPEIVAIGIKPYDLVWLEGKSAAWRYPSEVDELKAYAPAVEEQPYDRFYKKPEMTATVLQQQNLQQNADVVNKTEDHKRYEPKITINTNNDDGSSKKVYINFPGSINSAEQTPSKKTNTVTESPAPEFKKLQPPVFAERQPSAVTYSDIVEDSFTTKSSTGSAPKKAINKKTEKTLLFSCIAACALLVVFIAILLINNSRQRESLKQLSTIVQQMENRDKTPHNVPVKLVQQEVTPVPQADETPPSEITDPAPATKDPVVAEKRPVTKSPSTNADKNSSGTAATPSVVFHENTTADKPAPVEKKMDATPVSSENLYKLVSVKPNDFKTGLLGGISNLKFEITNNSLTELQRVAVEIKYLGPEKKVVKKQTVYFENVSPGSQETIEVPKSSRGVSIEYTITDIKS